VHENIVCIFGHVFKLEFIILLHNKLGLLIAIFLILLNIFSNLLVLLDELLIFCNVRTVISVAITRLSYRGITNLTLNHPPKLL